MMKMMDRIVEGRGHLREIDMLLELTSVFFPAPLPPPIPDSYICLSLSIYWFPPHTVNKSRVGLFARLGTPLHGQFKV